MSGKVTQPPQDPFARFRTATRARIGLGRSGDALPTAALLEFQAAHGRARDAVHGAVEFEELARQLAPIQTLLVRSGATDRAIYLRRPDLGRQLAPSDCATVEKASSDWDLVFVIADGLSADAVSRHAAPMLRRILPLLEGWRIAPVVLASQARVALGDDIAHRLGARMVAVLIGERPGLSVADSLGIYLTWAPRPGRADSERNCISNIHGDGLSYEAAARTLVWLMQQARHRQLTGVQLKIDNVPSAPIENQS